MSETEHDYSEAWPIYDDEDEPWKDFDRLLRLREEMDTQAEMGDALGCTPSTISYWLDKARDEVEPDYDDEEFQCRFHDVCGNKAPAPKSGICIVCLDLMRHNDTAQGIDPTDSETMEKHIEKLHEEYAEVRDEAQAVHDNNHSKDSEAES